MAKSSNDILTGDIKRQILVFFFPILFGTFFQQLYNTVDAMIVGNFVGKEALGAVGGSTGTLINLLVGFIVGVSGGATVVIAQYYGKRDGEAVSKAVKTGMFLAISSGTVIMIAGIILAPNLLKLMNVPSDIYDYSLTYMRVYFAGLIPAMIYNMGAGILRAIGDSKRPLYFLIVSTIVNIILDLLFVRFLNLKVFGAAFATVLSQVASCILTLMVLKRSDDSYSFELKELSFEKQLLISIAVIGLPSGIQSVLYSVSNVFIQSNINSFGTDTVAAYTAFGKIDAVFWMFSGAIGTAAMTIAGQNFGANKIDRVKKTIWTSLGLFVLGTIIVGGALYLGGKYILALFTKDTNVIEIGYSLLKYMVPTYFTFAIVEIMSSCIRACGDSLVPMIMTAVGICGFRVLWLMIMPLNDLFDIMVCYPISWIITSALLLLYYLSGIWLKRCLKKRDSLISRT